MKNRWIFLTLMGFLLTLIDNQLLNFIQFFSSDKIMVTSHLFLLFLIISSGRLAYDHLVIGSISIGIFYDSYFLGQLGFSCLLFVFYALLAKLFIDKMPYRFYTVILLQLIIIFMHKLFYYFLLSSAIIMPEFLLWDLLPSLLFNLIIAVILYPLFDKILKSNRYSIVTNA